VTRALWGAVSGGKDITVQVAALVKDGALAVDATTEALGDDGVPDTYKRLELEYTCHGRRSSCWPSSRTPDHRCAGEQRTERAPRKP